MGMFDVIRWNYYLPDEEFEGQSFQTKDLENVLDTYVVESDGLLYHLKKQSPSSFKYNWNFYDLTDTINFYKFRTHYCINNQGNVGPMWIEFEAYFVSGKCQSVMLIKKRLKD